jgi:hypothetical protein
MLILFLICEHGRMLCLKQAAVSILEPVKYCNDAVLVSTRNVSVFSSVLACMKRFSGHYYEPFQWSLHSNLLKRFGGLYGNEHIRFRLHVWPHSRKNRFYFWHAGEVNEKSKQTKGNKRKQKETKGNKTTT